MVKKKEVVKFFKIIIMRMKEEKIAILTKKNKGKIAIKA